MRHENYDAQGRLRVRRDDVARTFTRWDENGSVVEERPYTAEEAAAADSSQADTTRQARYATLLERAEAAQQGNRDFLAITTPTAAQNAAQIKALTRQNNALMQLVLRLAGRFAAMDAPD